MYRNWGRQSESGSNARVAKIFFAALLKEPQNSWILRNARNGRILADKVGAAVDSRSRRTGLLEHATFDEGHALIIAPTSAIHTCFMQFPIDVAFVRRDGQIVKARSAVKPWRISGALRAFAVIELPSGTLKRSETIAGDSLELAWGGREGDGAR